jgi:hypothetical protein
MGENNRWYTISYGDFAKNKIECRQIIQHLTPYYCHHLSTLKNKKILLLRLLCKKKKINYHHHHPPIFLIQSNINRKFWEELIACFPFTTIWIFDKSRKKTFVCMHNGVKKKTAREAVVLILLIGVIYKLHRSYGLRWYDTYTPSFMMIGWVIQGLWQCERDL